MTKTWEYLTLQVDREEKMCEMSISLPVHIICTVCAVLVKENQAHRFGIKVC